MKVTITDKNENKLLHRTMLRGQLEFAQATPSNAQLAEALAKEVKKDLNLVVIKNIYTQFGKQQASFTALVYEQQSAKEQLEKKTKHLKKKAAEGAPAEAGAAAEKPQEKKGEGA